MPKITLNLDNDELVVLEHVIVDVEEWLTNIVKDKIRKSLDRVVLNNTRYRPETMSLNEKRDLVDSVTLTSAKDRLKQPINRR